MVSLVIQRFHKRIHLNTCNTPRGMPQHFSDCACTKRARVFSPLIDIVVVVVGIGGLILFISTLNAYHPFTLSGIRPAKTNVDAVNRFVYTRVKWWKLRSIANALTKTQRICLLLFREYVIWMGTFNKMHATYGPQTLSVQRYIHMSTSVNSETWTRIHRSATQCFTECSASVILQFDGGELLAAFGASRQLLTEIRRTHREQ